MISPSLLMAASLALGALTPAKVTDVKTNASALPAARPPHVIYVDRFTLPQPEPKTDESSDSDDSSSGGGRPHLFGMFRGGSDNTLIGRHREEQHEETLAKLPAALQKALVDDLATSIAAATAGDGAGASRVDCWVITGRFIDVNQGSGALQAGVGFGAGQSSVEVRAQVYALRDMDTPFLVFDSKGASGHMPGAVAMHNPYVAAAKFVMSKKQPDKEAKKVAKSIAEAIGKFMAAQGIPTLQAKGGSSGASESPTPASASSKRSD